MLDCLTVHSPEGKAAHRGRCFNGLGSAFSPLAAAGAPAAGAAESHRCRPQGCSKNHPSPPLHVFARCAVLLVITCQGMVELEHHDYFSPARSSAAYTASLCCCGMRSYSIQSEDTFGDIRRCQIAILDRKQLPSFTAEKHCMIIARERQSKQSHAFLFSHGACLMECSK